MAFVNFNYDRCLEHFLYRALIQHSGFAPPEAAAIVSSIEILHPYGSIGPLDWQQNGVAYGQDLRWANLGQIAENIRTFSEEAGSQDHAAVKALIGGAQRVVFLGCAHHPQNLALVEPARFEAGIVYGTMYLPPPPDPEGHAAPPMAEFAYPAIQAFKRSLGSWSRPAGAGGVAFSVEPLTSRQLVARYGSEWTDPDT